MLLSKLFSPRARLNDNQPRANESRSTNCSAPPTTTSFFDTSTSATLTDTIISSHTATNGGINVIVNLNQPHRQNLLPTTEGCQTPGSSSKVTSRLSPEQMGREDQGISDVVSPPHPVPPPHLEPPAVASDLHVSPRSQPRSRAEVYHDNLLSEGRGLPVYMPSPDLNLPKACRKSGVGPGDVITMDRQQGAIVYLFNVLASPKDPINLGRVPESFTPFNKPPDISRYSRPAQVVRSAGIQISANGTGYAASTEGALVVMPLCTTATSIVNTAGLKRYLKKQLKSWYEYALGRGWEVENGALLLVTGCEKTSRWGMATFLSEQSVVGQVRFLTEQDNHHGGVPYIYICSGSADAQTGPQPTDMEDLRDPGSDKLVENQCLFLHTLKASLDAAVFQEISLRVEAEDSSDIEFAPVDRQTDGPSPGYRPAVSSPVVHFNPTTKFSVRQANARPLQLGLYAKHQSHKMDHPLSGVNQLLLQKYPEAEIVITEDVHWMAVVSKNEPFPPAEVLLTRLEYAFNLTEGDGVVTFEPPAVLHTSKNTAQLHVSSSASSEGVSTSTADDRRTVFSDKLAGARIPARRPSAAVSPTNDHGIYLDQLEPLVYRQAASIRTMPVLDYDILREIASYLPKDELSRVKSANSVFLSEHMRANYTAISLLKKDEDVKKLLTHLADPEADVARWVRRVKIAPWLIQPHTNSPQNRTETLLSLIGRTFDPHLREKLAQERLVERLTKRTARVANAFWRMSNVEEYEIISDESHCYHPEFYHALLTPTLSLWSGHLQKLTLKIPPAFVDTLAGIRLPVLHTMCITFATGSLTTDEIRIAHTGFVVFINNLDRSLQSLSFISTNHSENIDMSHFFRQLGTFPQLQSFSVSIPFDGSQLTDPMTVVLFLERHRSPLRELNLFTSSIIHKREGGAPSHIEWIQNILGGIKEPFPLLRSLGVALRPLRYSLDTLIAFLDNHTTLKSLKLMDRSLTAQELENLFRSPITGSRLASSIDTLYMKVDSLDPRILNRMTCLLPNLEDLSIEANMVTGRGPTFAVQDLSLSTLLKPPSPSTQASPGVGLRSLSLALPNFADERRLQPYLELHLPHITPINLKTTALPHGQFIY